MTSNNRELIRKITTSNYIFTNNRDNTVHHLLRKQKTKKKAN